MYWTCEKCETKNPENSLACGKCGAKSTAKHKFYASWITGSAIVFLIAYFIGAFFGGTLVAFSIEPVDEQVLAMAKSQGVEAEKLENLKPDQRDKAKAAAIEKARAEMSGLVRAVLFWFLLILLYPLGGVVVGYVSEGRTILEVAIGSVVGQGVGFAAMRFMYGVDISWVELIVGLVVGFVLSGVGAYVGEAVQEKRERVALELEEMDTEFQ